MANLLDSAFSDPSFKWDAKWSRHLLNRAGFGVPPSSAAKLAALKPEDAVAAFVDYERLPDQLPTANWLPEDTERPRYRQAMQGMSEDERRMLRQDFDRESRDSISRLQVWWLDRMCHTLRPLEEKLTLFWHGHFATSSEKVKEPTSNFQLNQVFRRNASGNFTTLVREVGKSPAMLRYLDQNQSRKQKPNENWARELMELFTLGTGNYSEQDIKELARAFTGWQMRDGEFFFGRGNHDPSAKTIFGKSGMYDGDAAVDLVTSQPACAPFICRKLWTFFAYDNPEQEIVDGLANTFRASRMELKPVLRQMFSSRGFYSEKSYASQVKSPAQLIVNLLMQLDAPIDEKPPIAQLAMRAMGQSLFAPPNVKGWDGGRAWINTNTLLVRYNFANFLVSGVVPDFGRGGQGEGGQLARELANFANRRARNRNGEGGMMNGGEGDGSMMQGGDGMQMNPERGSAPAGQDAMAPDNASQTLYGALRQRRDVRRAEKPSKEQEAMGRAPFRARDFFARYEGMTAEEMVDQLAIYFVGWPLEDDQRRQLLVALTKSGIPAGKPISTLRIPETDLRATVQLLLSTAEYQVC